MIPTHPFISHSPHPTLQGDPKLAQAITFATTLVVVFAIGVALILKGLI